MTTTRAKALLISAVVMLLISISACSSQPSSATTTPAPSMSPMSSAALVDAFNTGKLKFEVRELQNKSSKSSYGGTSYHHEGIVVVTGEPQYAKGAYLLYYSVKRLSGGDPENTRPPEDYTTAFIHDGIGHIQEPGGYRTPDEKWEPEKIEIKPFALLSLPTLNGEAMQEH
jgi:hypothetical protein